MKDFWDERYRDTAYVYGTSPNLFLKEQMAKFVPGKILFPCEGEGRNAVYAAQQGWQVDAFDTSTEGRRKALLLGKEKKVAIRYQIADAISVTYPDNYFDAVALIYAHFPPDVRKVIHRKIINWIRPGGIILLEAFTPLQLGNTSGGPKDPAQLYTEEILKEDFSVLRKFEILQSEEINLSEGKFHRGKANVIRMVAMR